MAEQRMRKITSLRFSTKNYVVGQKGVKTIQIEPPMAVVEYEDGHMTSMYIPMDVVYWDHVDAGPVIELPNKEIVTP